MVFQAGQANASIQQLKTKICMESFMTEFFSRKKSIWATNKSISDIWYLNKGQFEYCGEK